MGYARFTDEGPRAGGPILGFVAVLAVTGLSLVATSDGFLAEPQARAVSAIVYSPAIDPVEVFVADETGSNIPIDLTETSSVEAGVPLDESSLCDVDACASKYQSFMASDCTFQPFDGPRRICAY